MSHQRWRRVAALAFIMPLALASCVASGTTGTTGITSTSPVAPTATAPPTTVPAPTVVATTAAPSTTQAEAQRPPIADGPCSAAALGNFYEEALFDFEAAPAPGQAPVETTRIALIEAAIACDFDTLVAWAWNDVPPNGFGWGTFWGEPNLSVTRLRDLDSTDNALWDLAVALIYLEPYWDFVECEDDPNRSWACGMDWYEWPDIRAPEDYPLAWLDRLALIEGLSADELRQRLRGGYSPFAIAISTAGDWIAAYPRKPCSNC
jgi:hypothetical protein